MLGTSMVFCVLRGWAEAGHANHTFPETLYILSLVCGGGVGVG